MNDYYNHLDKSNDTKFEKLWSHILAISKGNCDITDEMVLAEKDEQYRMILGGLQLLHEDLNLFKEDLAQKLEADHQLEILKKKNEELAQFNYVASHDLQEPLRTLTSFTKLLVKKYDDQLDETGKKYLHVITQSVNRMDQLINDLLNYSRIGSVSGSELIDCNQLINGILNELKEEIKEADAKIFIKDLPTINANRNDLYRLFINLMSNAIKFRKKDQPLEITVSAKMTDLLYKFCVTDNGIGLDQKYKDQIFGIFSRLESRDKFEGTGIGLASCKKIAEMYGGKIWVESELGKGSSFCFTLLK